MGKRFFYARCSLFSAFLCIFFYHMLIKQPVQDACVMHMSMLSIKKEVSLYPVRPLFVKQWQNFLKKSNTITKYGQFGGNVIKELAFEDREQMNSSYNTNKKWTIVKNPHSCSIFLLELVPMHSFDSVGWLESCWVLRWFVCTLFFKFIF